MYAPAGGDRGGASFNDRKKCDFFRTFCCSVLLRFASTYSTLVPICVIVRCRVDFTELKEEINFHIHNISPYEREMY
jgi:hypothetical protein